MKNIKLLIPPIISLMIILGTSAVIIAYGRGYRPNQPGNGSTIIRTTGLLSATSDPVGAQVFVDGTLRTATNNSFNVDPGKRTVRIQKEGYLPWQKDISIEQEIVSRADAWLFPINPSLSPLTNTGIVNPTLSDDGNRIAYLVPPKDSSLDALESSGLWVYELVDNPLGFNRTQRKVGVWVPNWANNIPSITWSPDSQQLLLTTTNEVRVYTVSRSNEFTAAASPAAILDEWSLDRQTKQLQQLSALKQPFIDLATSSAKIVAFSPDETKVLYQATQSATLPIIITPPLVGTNSTEEIRDIEPGKLYVYDSKEDKNYFLFDLPEVIPPTPTPTPTPTRTTAVRTVAETIARTGRDLSLPTTYPIRWFPTNRHLVLTLQGKIDILEYDRTNWVTVYAGPFQDNFIAPWPEGSRLIIVSNLNPGASPLPNLFTVNLR